MATSSQDLGNIAPTKAISLKIACQTLVLVQQQATFRNSVSFSLVRLKMD